MADLLIDNQTSPATPAAGKSDAFFDATTTRLAAVADDGTRRGGALSKNSSVGSLAIAAADTYVTNSGILIPSWGMEAGQIYRWQLTVTKTAAGVAQAIYNIRVGAAGAIGDTARLALTATTAQTAAISSGVINVFVIVRNVGAAGVLAGGVGVQSNNAGLGSGISGVAASFDNSALAGQFVGLSINNGAAGAWTVEAAYGELVA